MVMMAWPPFFLIYATASFVRLNIWIHLALCGPYLPLASAVMMASYTSCMVILLCHVHPRHSRGPADGQAAPEVRDKDGASRRVSGQKKFGRLRSGRDAEAKRHIQTGRWGRPCAPPVKGRGASLLGLRFTCP